MVPAVAVGAKGVPVKVGEAILAFKSKAVCCSVDTGLSASEVLFTLPKPTIDLSIPDTVPVKVGESDNTTLPVPVSSEITPANSVEVVVDITFNLSVVTTNVFEVGMAVLLILVAVATPNSGVTNVGEVFITNVEPVPVCEATEVSFPTLVIGPVKSALVAFAVLTAEVTNSVVAT